ncbi:MAG: DMT family transporter [Ilumatobacteraceae bacterium]
MTTRAARSTTSLLGAWCYTDGMPIVLALGSAIVYGVSDYLGGRVSRRWPPVVVALAAELTVLLITVALVPVIEPTGPSGRAVWWGIVGGVAGSAGVLGLYAALSHGNMTVVAPVTGIVAAIVPVAIGVALGERPSTVTSGGIVLAVVAVALIGGIVGVGHQRLDAGILLLAVAVGSGFGLLFVAYSRTGDDAGTWPLLMSRIGATPLLVAAFVVAHRRGGMPPLRPAVALPGAAIGVLILVANGLYLIAARDGLLTVVAVLVALYPASTVAFAALLDHERASRWQITGMGVAAIAVALITV